MFTRSWRTLAFSLTITATTAPVQAAHWEWVSFADSTYLGNPDIVRGARSTITASVPSGSVYGTGPFKFYGESAEYFFSERLSNPGLAFSGNSTAYYTFVYKWVADDPEDVPPQLNDTVEVSGYSLERGGFGLLVNDPLAYAGAWSWILAFNSLGKIWGGFGFPAVFPSTPYDHKVIWPLATDTPNITIGMHRYYVRPVALGGGPVTLDGSGNRIVTLTVLNDQDFYQSTDLASSSGAPTLKTNWGGDSFCYKGAAEIMGLPVQ